MEKKKSAKELWQQHTNEFHGKPISGGHFKGNIKLDRYIIK